MKYLVFIFLIVVISCTKEVNIDIPQHQDQLVIDGLIETNLPPIVLMSKSQNVYAPTDLDSYITNIINDAEVWVSNGIDSVQLELFQANNLPIGLSEIIAAKLNIKLNELSLLPISFYSTNNPSMIGEVNKQYDLKIIYKNQKYDASTTILEPAQLDDLYWQLEPETIEYGFSWARLSDPAIQNDCYKWEVKRLDTWNGKPKDEWYKTARDPYFNDRYFNGLTFDFSYENPMGRKGDTTHIKDYRRYYRLGDTVVVKLSKMDEATFDFFEKKRRQISSNGSPFASPINVPTNISGGALGVWAGFSPYYDTLYCVE